MEIKTAASNKLNFLYHYQDCNLEYLESMFSKGVIHFSNPENFNDPWDCRPCYDKSILDDGNAYKRIVKWYVDLGRKHNPGASESEHTEREKVLLKDRKRLEWMIDEGTSEIGKEILRKYRVYCLSQHPDSTLMWSHYADSFRGVCLEFSTENELFCGAFQVDYQSKYPKIDVSAGDEESARQMVLTKSSDWTYEDEYRLIATESQEAIQDMPTTKNGFLPLPKNSLKAVIFGSRVSTQNREFINKMIRASGWNVVQKETSLLANHYSFEVKTID